MRTVLVTAGFVAVMLLAPGAPAEATVYGAQGLMTVPSALVPRDGVVSVGATGFAATNRRPSGAETHWTWFAATADVGVGGRGETGVTYLHRKGGKIRDGLGLFGKVEALTETERRPAVSIGADAIHGKLRTTQAYVVATKVFNPRRAAGSTTASLGGIYAWDRDGEKVDDADFYCGLSVGLSDRVSAVAEWRQRTAGFPKAGSGVMLQYGVARYAIGVGLLNSGNSDKHGFFIGAGFNIPTLD